MGMIVCEVDGTSLQVATKPDLFSPKALDIGSRLLLDSVKTWQYEQVLDWGCGWGAIGLWLAKRNSRASITMLDSDIAAVATAQSNATHNELGNATVLASHGYEQLSTDAHYDLICSNPPTHRGREVVDMMIAQSFDRLTPGGKLVLVVEARIKPWVAREMTKTFGSYKILKRGPKNVVLVSVKE